MTKYNVHKINIEIKQTLTSLIDQKSSTVSLIIYIIKLFFQQKLKYLHEWRIYG